MVIVPRYLLSVLLSLLTPLPSHVAARIVNKQRADQSETQEARANDRNGQSPNHDLTSLNHPQFTQLRDYERDHLGRKTLLDALERQL